MKDRERILRAARERKKILIYKETLIRWSDFLVETLQARRNWNDIIKVLKKTMPAKNTPSGKIILQN